MSGGQRFLFTAFSRQVFIHDAAGSVITEIACASLMNSFMEALPTQQSAKWFQTNVKAFLEVCEAHGEAASQHHNQLVEKFIKEPAVHLPEENQSNLTSGPPLPVLLFALEKLRDQRMAHHVQISTHVIRIFNN